MTVRNLTKLVGLTGLLFALSAVAGKPGSEPPIEVDAVDPPAAEQGQMLRVKVVGNGFAKGDTVRFLITVNGVEDDSQILVGPATFVDSDPDYPGFDTLTADIEVLGTAPVSENYDVEVQSRKGRKGKGTTLFAVQQKPNQNPPVSCDSLAPGGTCTCWFNSDGGMYRMIGDCETAETLFVEGSIRSETSPNGDAYTLTAVGPFDGTSVIVNTDHQSQTSTLDIVIGDSAVAGCGATDLQSAVRYVLDESTPDPTDPPEGNVNAIMAIWETSVSTGPNNPLCRAFEVRRTQAYTDAWPDSLDWRVWLQDNVVAPGSYIEAGIVYHGVLKPVNPTTGPLVSGNFIGAPSCVDPDAAIAIDFGPSHVVGASHEMEDEVLTNTIDMVADCGSGLQSHGVGVFLQGSTDGTRTTAQISKNTISGAMIGVLANDDMVKINLSNNTFVGDGVNGSGDIAVCSDAGITTEKGKRSTYSNWDDNVQTGGCLAP